MATDDLVKVLVPRRHLSQVYGFIARLEASEMGSAPRVPIVTADDHTQSSGSDGDEWTQSRLRRMVHESPPAMVKILEALAAKPGQWLSTADLAAAISPEANWQTVAGTLGAAGRRVASRYGLDSFPFENRFDHAARARRCRMSDETARAINQLIAERV